MTVAAVKTTTQIKMSGIGKCTFGSVNDDNDKVEGHANRFLTNSGSCCSGIKVDVTGVSPDWWMDRLLEVEQYPPDP